MDDLFPLTMLIIGVAIIASAAVGFIYRMLSERVTLPVSKRGNRKLIASLLILVMVLGIVGVLYQTHVPPSSLAVSSVYSDSQYGTASPYYNDYPGQYASTQTFQANNAGGMTTCSIMVYLNGTYTTMQDCSTKAILFYSTSATSVINDAAGNLTAGGEVYVKAGTYTLGATIHVSNPDIDLIGEGRATKFVLTSGFGANDVIDTGAANLVFENFMVDASQQTKGDANYVIAVGNDNATLAGLYLSNGDRCIGTNNKQTIIVDNYITNCGRAITLQSGAYLDTIADNSVDQSNVHSEITINAGAKNITVTGNTLSGSGDAAIIMNNPTALTSKYIVITGNVIATTATDGVSIYAANGGVDAAEYVTISANTISSPENGDGIIMNSGKYIVVADNIIDNVVAAGKDGIFVAASDVVLSGNMITFPGEDGIKIASGVENCTISGNHIYYPGAKGIETVGTTQFLDIVGNTVLSNAGDKSVYLTGVTYFSLTGNDITSQSGFATTAVALYGSSKYGTVSSNNIWSATDGIKLNPATNIVITNNMISKATTCISEASTSDNNRIQSNYIGSCSTTITIVGNHTIAMDNSGYNAIGNVTNPVFSGGSGGNDGNWLSPRGTSHTLVASTTYTVINTPVTITIYVVGGATISIDGKAAFTPTAGESWTLYPTQTINFGAFGASAVPNVQFVFQ